MLDIHRDRFAPDAVKAVAYSDRDLKVREAGGGAPARGLASPRIEAKLIQALGVDERSQVLVVGALTGYASAVLGRLAATVIALEADPSLAAFAREALATTSASNVTVVLGPHATGVSASAPYDAILLEGTVPDVNPVLLDQLKDGGRLIAVVDDNGVGRAMLWRRVGGTFDRTAVFDAAAPVLPGFEREPAFVF
jgi:protein-L-isoaspartate(D-aspartate) O-methyltransferase